MLKVDPSSEQPFSASSALRNITDIPAVSRLDLSENGSLSLAPDFHHGLLEQSASVDRLGIALRIVLLRARPFPFELLMTLFEQ